MAPSPHFVVGQTVQVQSRTWPGINQPGGVGRITAVADDCVSVRYILDGRHERQIKSQYVSIHEQDASRSLRDRSMLLGRCRACGALRSDCGSCEVRSTGNIDIRTRHLHDILSSSSSDEDSIAAIVRQFHGSTRRLKLIQSRRLQLQSLFGGSSSDLSEGGRRSDQHDQLSQIEKDDDDDSILQEMTQAAAQSASLSKQSRKRRKMYDRLANESVLMQIGLTSSPNSASSNLSFASQDLDSDGESLTCMPSPFPPSRASKIRSDYKGTPDQWQNERDQLFGDPTWAEFIQPEGDAGALPQDMQDSTLEVPFYRLPAFVVATLNKLETEDLPKAKQQVRDLERRCRSQLTGDEIADVQRDIEALYDDFIVYLIRQGVDQCQFAVKKMSSRKMYKKHKAGMTDVEREQFRPIQVDILGNHLDAVGSTLEDLMATIRKLMLKLGSEDKADTLSSDDSCDSSRGGHEESPEYVSEGSLLHNSPNLKALSPFDRHKYARKRNSIRLACIQPEAARDKHVPYQRKNGYASRRRSENGVSLKASTYSSTQELSQLNENVALNHDLSFDARQRNRHTRKRRVNTRDRAGTLTSATDAFGPILHDLDRNIHVDAPDRVIRSVTSQQACHGSRPNGGSAARTRWRSSPHQQSSLTEKVFADLERRTTLRRTDNVADVPRSSTFNISWLKLVEKYPDPACLEGLDLLSGDAAVAQLVEPEHSSLAFHSLWKAMNTLGWPILQEFVSRDNQYIISHAKLLSTLLTLLRFGWNSHLTPVDGIIYVLFSPQHCSKWVRNILLQTVDSVFSLFHPLGWGLKVRSRVSILEQLAPLRNALAEHCHVLDSVSQCILCDMLPQRWYVASDSHVFVSSVNPLAWKACSEGGKDLATVIGKEESRFDSFNLNIPRCEIDTIWSVFAYLAFNKQPQHCAGQQLWSLISVIFSKGVLSMDPYSDQPIGQAQLSASITDVGRLRKLVATGSMDASGMPDSVVLRVIRSSLELQSAATQLDGQSSIDWKFGKRATRKFWDDLSSGSSFRQAVVSLPLFASYLEDRSATVEITDQYLFLPARDVTRTCLALLCAWVGRLPTKKLRRKRWRKSLLLLIQDIFTDDRATSIHRAKSNAEADSPAVDSFQDAFLESEGCNMTSKSSHNSLLVAEACAFLLITSTTTTGLTISLLDNDQYALQDNCWDLAEELWSLFANASMKNRCLVIWERGSREAIHEYSRGAERLVLAAKPLAFLTLLLTGLVPVGRERTIWLRGNIFQDRPLAWKTVARVMTCVCACLDCACDLRESVEAMLSILALLGSILGALKSSVERDASLIGKDLLRMFEQVAIRCLTSLACMSTCSVNAENCLLAVVTLLCEAVLFAHRAAGRPERTDNSDAAVAEDAWGGLDDSLVATLDVDFGVPHQENVRDDLIMFLLRVLDESKPTTRFGLQSVLDVTSQSKILFARCSSEICRCLATLVSVSPHLSARVQSELLTVNRRIDGRQVQDQDYLRSLGNVFASSLIELSDNSGNIAAFREAIFDCMLESLVDIFSLDRISSTTLSHCTNNEQHALQEIEYSKSFENGGLRSAQTSLDSLWRLVDGVGGIFSDGDGQFALYMFHLRNDDSDMPEKFESTIRPSIERELIRRLKLIRGIISAGTPQHSERHERTLAIILAASANQVLILAKEPGLMSSDEFCRDYASEKLRIVSSTYCAFHIAIIAWVLREHVLSGDFETKSLFHALMAYLSAIFGRNGDTIAEALVGLVDSGLVVMNEKTNPPGDTISVRPLPMLTCDDLLDSVIKRSRELALLVSHAYPFSTRALNVWRLIVAHALTSDHDTVTRVAAAISPTVSTTFPTNVRNDPSTLDMDAYFAFIDLHRPVSSNEHTALASLRYYTVQSLLLSRLMQVRLKTPERVRTLNFLRLLIDAAGCESTPDDEDSLWNLDLICKLKDGILLSSRIALTYLTMNNDLMVSIYCSARSLLRSTFMVTNEESDRVLHWCSKNKDSSNHQASFLFNAASLLHELGDSIRKHYEDQNDRFGSYREALRLLDGKRDRFAWVQFNSESNVPAELVRSAKALFGEKENVQCITNVYAMKGATQVTTKSLDAWTPNEPVIRAIEEFTASFVSATSIT